MNGMKMMIGSLPMSGMMGGNRPNVGSFNPAAHVACFNTVGEYVADAALEDRGVLVSAKGVIATVRARKLSFQEAADARNVATGLYVIMFPVPTGAKEDAVTITTTRQDVLFDLLAVDGLPDELFVQMGFGVTTSVVKAITDGSNEHIRVLADAGGITPDNTAPSHLIVDKKRNRVIGRIAKESPEPGVGFDIFSNQRKSKSSQDYIISVSTNDQDIIKYIVVNTVEAIVLDEVV